MRLAACIVLLAVSVLCLADDREKAEKQLRKITAMATDKTGRCMVSVNVADFFKVPRPALVDQRRQMSLDYGSYFLFQELQRGGVPIKDLVNALQSQQTVWQIADQHHADWDRIADDAKKVNNRIDDSIYRHFLNKKYLEADQQRDFEDRYDPVKDAVRTDFDISPKEMADAQTRYILWRNRAGAIQASGHMTSQSQLSAQYDRTAASHSREGTSAPPAGGINAR
jgi:hypothetical protein